MHEISFDETLEVICAHDARFHRDAYIFVREALDYTQNQINKDVRDASGRAEMRQSEKHVTGQQLLEGIRQCALTQFGPMAITVFEEWGIRHCRDFGEIVFNMVEASLLKKTETDSRGDFENGYDFHEAFRQPFLPAGKLEASRPPEKETR